MKSTLPSTQTREGASDKEVKFTSTKSPCAKSSPITTPRGLIGASSQQCGQP